MQKDYRVNIKTLLDETGHNQTQLANAIGCTPQKVSQVLNPSLKSTERKDFTINDIYRIAEFFDVTPNEILGYDELKSITKSETLSDFLKLFFKINARQEILINDDLSISFQNCHTLQFLKEWKELKACSLDESFKEEVLEMWKEKILKKSKEVIAAHGYKTKEEFVPVLVQLALDNFYWICEADDKKIPKELTIEENVELIEEYIEIILKEKNLTEEDERERDSIVSDLQTILTHIPLSSYAPLPCDTENKYPF